MGILFAVTSFVFFVCSVTDFSATEQPINVKFCAAVTFSHVCFHFKCCQMGEAKTKFFGFSKIHLSAIISKTVSHSILRHGQFLIIAELSINVKVGAVVAGVMGHSPIRSNMLNF